MAQQTQEQDINHLLKVRREKLAELQQNGRDPFQITKFDQTHHSLEVKGLYEAHETELLKDRQEPNVEGMDEEQAKEALKKDYEERRNIMDANPIHVAIAGRMMFKRVMGKASFCNVQDLKGNIQCYVCRDDLGEDSYKDFKRMDIGDIVGVEGESSVGAAFGEGVAVRDGDAGDRRPGAFDRAPDRAGRNGCAEAADEQQDNESFHGFGRFWVSF